MLGERTNYYVMEDRCNKHCGTHCGPHCGCGNRVEPVAACNRQWNALDPTSEFPFSADAAINQNAAQASDIEQSSYEKIIIRDSCDIKVKTTDTQVAVSLQAALQVAIALVVNLTIADSDQAEKVTQQLLQYSQIEQINRQTICIENSRDIEVTTTDTDVAISIQLMLQLLLALLIQIDIL